MSLIISQYEKYQRRVYEWMEGPLVDAVQCDVNGDTQCIIERSFRQIGRLSFVLWLPDLFCGFVFVVARFVFVVGNTHTCILLTLVHIFW